MFLLGIHEDEAGMMYDAWSLANYGTDRFLTSCPIYLTNFGGGQSILYAAISAILIKMLGFSLLVVRIPSAFFSLLAIILGYFIVKKFTTTKKALLFSFLIAICPWHIMQSRWGLDCNLMSSFFMLDIFLLLSSKKHWHFVLTGICFGITLYTYALSYFILPVLFLSLCIYLLILKKVTLKQILIMFIPILILAFPLLLVQIVNIFGLQEIHIGPFTIPRLPFYRSSEIGISNVLNNLNPLRTNNIFSLWFAFDHNTFNAFPAFGTLYYVLIPFVLIGLFYIIRNFFKNKKIFSLDTIFLITFIASFLCILFFSDLQLYKLNTLFIPSIYFAVKGLMVFYKRFPKCMICFCTFLILCFGIFEIYYFENIDKKSEPAFNRDFIPLVQYLEQSYPNQKILFNTDTIQPYIYLLIANKTSPYDFTSSSKLYDSYFGIESIGRYTFYAYSSNFKVNEDTIYVLEEDNAFYRYTVNLQKQVLEKEGFTLQTYHNFSIYKKEEKPHY